MAPARRWPLPLLMRVGWAGSVLFAGFFTVAPLVTLVVGGRFSVGTEVVTTSVGAPPRRRRVPRTRRAALGDRVRLPHRACVGAVGLRGALDRAGRRGCRAGGRAPSGSDRQRARGGRVSGRWRDRGVVFLPETERRGLLPSCGGTQSGGARWPRRLITACS